MCMSVFFFHCLNFYENFDRFSFDTTVVVKSKFEKNKFDKKCKTLRIFVCLWRTKCGGILISCNEIHNYFFLFFHCETTSWFRFALTRSLSLSLTFPTSLPPSLRLFLLLTHSHADSFRSIKSNVHCNIITCSW